MKELTVQKISYTKTTKTTTGARREVSQREVIPTSVPSFNVKAIDVSDVSTLEREELITLLTEYRSYVEDATRGVFSFEDWVSHTKNKEITPKWRTFKADGIMIDVD